MAITAGRDWGTIFDPLQSLDVSVTVAFLGYMTICLFGILNVITSVFVESAMQSSQYYKDLLVQEKMLRQDTSIKHMKDIFKHIDGDNSGSISIAEMNEYLEDDSLQLQSYFEALDLNASDTATLFRLLDRDGSGCVEIDEFCDGCMRLKGNARSFDINSIQYDLKRQQNKLNTFMEFVTSKLNKCADNCDFVKDKFRAAHEQTVRVERAIKVVAAARPAASREGGHGAYQAPLDEDTTCRDMRTPRVVILHEKA